MPKFHYKKIIIPKLKDRGVISASWILSNVIKMQAVSINGRLKIANY